jgi:hypothetical protein
VPLHQDYSKFSRQLAQDESQFSRGLAWDQNMFGQQLGWDKDRFGQQLGWDRDRFGQEMDYNRWATEGGWEHQMALNEANKPGFWGSLGNIFGGFASGVGGGLGSALGRSDVNVKENIAPGRRGLTELAAMPIYDWNYSDDPEKIPFRQRAQHARHDHEVRAGTRQED